MLMACVAAGRAEPSGRLEGLLRQVDSAIECRGQMRERHLQLIDSMKGLATGVTDVADLYAIERQVYSLYRTFDIDSAYSVARRRLEHARALNDESRIISSSLNVAESSLAIGNVQAAMGLLDSVPRARMQPYHAVTLYRLYCEAYTTLQHTEGEATARERSRRQVDVYMDSLIGCYTPADMRWYEYRAHRELHRDNPKGALAILDEGIRKLGFPADDQAQLRLLGEIHSQLGDNEKGAEYYAMSSLLDLRHVRRDYKSLIALADILNDMGQYERSYSYIYAALDDASSSNAQARVWEIASSLPIISETYTAQQRANARTLKVFAIIIVVLAAALAVAFAITLQQMRRARRSGRQLDSANASLQESNRRLSAQSKLRIHYISQMLNMHSDFIGRMSQYRSSVAREARSARWQKVVDMLTSPSLEEEERRQLYAHFDEMFLSLFPGFISEVNGMLQPPYRLDEEARVLTPELRVVALRKLGIGDSSHIAAILHYSIQTVYNYRSRLKSWLSVSEDEFNERIS